MIPQLILIILTCLITGIQLSNIEETTRTGKIARAFGVLISKIVIFIILYYGDFWNPLIEAIK
jgi:hypothetical protein